MSSKSNPLGPNMKNDSKKNDSFSKVIKIYNLEYISSIIIFEEIIKDDYFYKDEIDVCFRTKITNIVEKVKNEKSLSITNYLLNTYLKSFYINNQEVYDLDDTVLDFSETTIFDTINFYHNFNTKFFYFIYTKKGIISLCLSEKLNEKDLNFFEILAENSIIEVLIKKFELQSLKLALSSIKARNDAHHHGSHVKANLKSDKIIERFNELYKDIDLCETQLINKEICIKDNKCNDTCKQRKLLKDIYFHVFKDYLLDLYNTFDINQTNFATDLETSKSGYYFFKDVMVPYIKQTLILDNIAKGEQLCFYYNTESEIVENRLRFKFVYKEKGKNEKTVQIHFPELLSIYKKNVEYPDYFPMLVIPSEKVLNESKIDEEEHSYESYKKALTTAYEKYDLKSTDNNQNFDDFRITMGTPHEFYSILENYIRNTSKHSFNFHTNKAGGCEITIEIDKIDNSTFQLSLYDNISKLDSTVLKGKIYNHIHEYVVKDNKITDAKGFADMKYHAYALSSANEISEDELKKHLKVIYKENDKFIEFDKNTKTFTDEKSFGYRFNLIKSYDAIWIGRENDKNYPDSIGFETFDEFLQYNKVLHAEFVVFEKEAFDNVSVETIKECLQKLPFRALYNNTEVLNTDVDKSCIVKHFIGTRQITQVKEEIILQEGNDYYTNLWENWLSRWTKGEKVHMLIYHARDNGLINFDKFKENYSLKGCGKPLNIDSCEIKLNDSIDISFYRKGNESNENQFERKEKTKYLFLDQHNMISSYLCKAGDYYIDIGKSSLDFDTLFSINDKIDDHNNKTKIFKLIESFLFKIVVIDERLGANLEDKENEYITSSVYFCNKISTNDNDKHNILFGSNSTQTVLNKNNFKFGQEDLTDIDCVIIHRTFVNSIKNTTSYDEAISELDVPFKIITSGAGKPEDSNKIENYKFKAISIFENLFDNKNVVSKYSIVQKILN